MMSKPSNMDDVIDSRDIIERIEELEADAPVDNDDGIELDNLRALADDCESVVDWSFGETLIRYSYFKEYAQELAEDCGMTGTSQTWPNNCIDWERAATELQIDYQIIEFNGVEYWIRA